MCLERFLAKCKTSGSDFTHLDLSGGKYAIVPSDRHEFFDLYTSAALSGARLHLSEKRVLPGPIVIDLDFRQRSESRVYDRGLLESFAFLLRDTLRSMTDLVCDDPVLTCYVLEKSAPRPSGQPGVFKDGVHIVMPGAVADGDLQMQLRTAVLEVIDDVLANPFENPWNAIYDKSVIATNSWLLLGSCKPDDPDCYRLTAVQRADGVWQTDALPEFPELVRRLSIHGHADREPLTWTPPAAAPAASSSMDLSSMNAFMDTTQSRWSCEPIENGGFMAYSSCRRCLVHPSAEHSSHKHSVLFVHPDRVTVSCFHHGSKRITGELSTKIRALFGYSVTTAEREKPKPFEILRDKLLSAAKARNVKKLEGYVYEQTHQCTYKLWGRYDEFLREVMRGDPIYTSHPKYFEQLLKFMAHYDEAGLQNLSSDQNLVAFNNGVLCLKERSFLDYGHAELDGKVARHHIDATFDGSTETPLFDRLCLTQLSQATYEFLLVLIGRLFFPVGAHDNWQVMLFLLGDSGTGKSSLINVITAMFNPAAVASLSNNTERVFGLEAKYDKQLLVGYDTPKDMNNVLEQTLFQSMVSGETVSVPRKGLQALSVRWTVPMVMASNHTPTWKDASGAVSRRMCSFVFRNYLPPEDKDSTLQDRIKATELPGILLKALQAYFAAVQEHGTKDVWSFAPPDIVEAREDVGQHSDYLLRFLTGSREDNASRTHYYYVLHEVGTHTDLAAVKNAYRNFMRYKHPEAKASFPEDQSAFKQLGYVVEKKHLCKSCGNLHLRGCCSNYARANRTCRVIIQNLKLVVEEKPLFGGQDDR